MLVMVLYPQRDLDVYKRGFLKWNESRESIRSRYFKLLGQNSISVYSYSNDSGWLF